MIRQSKAKKQNFLTGEVLEIVKEKPFKTVRGVHTVELFDAWTGKIVERIESENFISKIMEELQRQAALFAFLADSLDTSYTSPRYNGPMDSLSKYNTIFDVPWYFGSFPMSNIILTDYDGPEDPENEIIMRGRVIGWAGKKSTYSGSDTKRGSLNSSESFVKPGHIHLVYDWPTHAANGTFQSVYWNYDPFLNGIFGVIGKKTVQVTAPNGYVFLNNILARFKNGKLYFAAREASSNKIAILMYDFDVQTKEITNGAVYAVLNTTSIDVFDIASNGDIYVFTANTLFCFGTNGMSKNIPGTSQTTRSFSGYPKEFFCIAGQEFYIGARTNTGSSYPFQVARYDISNLSSPLEVRMISSTTISPTDLIYPAHYLPELNMFFMSVYNGYNYFLDRSTLDFSKNTPAPAGSNSYSYFPIVFSQHDKQFLEIRHLTPSNGDTTKRTITISPIGFIGARNLLPSPVTKTNTNTMKLTYDLYIDSY